MPASAETVILQHRLTEQVVVVALSEYLSGSKARFRNFKLKGQGQFIAPPQLPIQSIDPSRYFEHNTRALP